MSGPDPAAPVPNGPQPSDPREHRPEVPVEARLAAIETRLEYLTDLFGRRLRTDRERQQAVTAVQDQLRWTRQQADGQLLRPLLYDLVLLADRLGHGGEDSPLVGSARDEVRAILDKHGVRQLPSGPGAFDPSRQQAVGTTPTHDPDQHGQVAELVRHGYLHGEVLLRPQEVRVYALVDR